MKNSVYPPSMEHRPIFIRKPWGDPVYDFLKISNPSPMSFHTFDNSCLLVISNKQKVFKGHKSKYYLLFNIKTKLSVFL